jgi:hypothetical protein
MAETKVPAIKNIPANTDPETKLALESIKEALEVRLGRRGDPKDRAVTLRELIDSGLATDLAKAPYNPNIAGATGFGPATDEVGDVTVPPAPTSLTATGLFTDALLSWNQSTNAPPYGNHGFTEIWRSQSEDLSSAVLVGTTNAFIYTDKGLEYDRTYYYWVRFISTTNTPGPWSNMASATTIENIAATMAALSETLSNLPGYNLLQTGATAATIIKSSSQPSTRANGDALQLNDIWFDTDDSQVYTRNAANNAWVAARDATLVSLYGSTSYTGSTITAAMSSAQGNITTLTSANSARVSEITELEAITTGYSNSSTIAAAISSEATARASADGANATSITNLSAFVGSGNDNGGTAYSASNTIISHVNATDANAAAAYVLKVEANGAVAGMVLEASASDSGTGSAIQFQADKFAIWDGSGAAGSNSVAPFIVDSGAVYIDQARIKNAAILDAKIGTLNGGKIIADTITATQIDADTITATQINATGFLNAFFAKIGTLTADHITSSTITANDLLNVDTLNVKYFANVTPQIYSQTSAAYPLVRRGFYYTSTAHTGSSGEHLIGNTTITNCRNGGSWTVWLYGVFGNVTDVNVQYSFDNSLWVDSPNGPTFTWNAGTYRPYTYVYYDNQITGLSSSQHTIYFRARMNGNQNYTSLGLFILLDNMASTP